MSQQLAGKRILVVEDEYFIASDLKRALVAAGAEVVGPTGSASKGLDLVVHDGIQAAVLDVNLEGSLSFPIADALAAEGVPFLFVTGYDDWALPERFRDAPRVGKPFRPGAVVERVITIMGDET